MKVLIYMSLLALSGYSMGQISEDFSDGDFTTNPEWTGDDVEFRVHDGELQLFDDKTDDSHLFTTSTVLEGGVWEFLFRWKDFSSTGLSSSNEVFYYLSADNNEAPESHPIAGYLIRIGNTSDEISFYRQDSDLASLTELIDGSANGFGGVTKSSNGSVRIRVSREEFGIWRIEADINGGTNFVEIGTTVDITYTSSNYTGIFIDYSSGNASGYFFDDIEISSNAGPDLDPPTIDTVVVISETQVDVRFNEVVEESSVGNVSNYQIDDSSEIVSAELDDFNHRLVHLNIVGSNPGKLRRLSIQNVEDLAGNSMEEITLPFIIPKPPSFNELIISEIMYDPDPPVGLPNHEYLELHNPTSYYLSTRNVSLEDATSKVELPGHILNPGGFYLITSNSGASEFSDNAIGVPSFPSLNNTGEQLVLYYDDQLVFSLNYDPDWHDQDKRDGGYSLELVDVENPCLETRDNWQSSVDPKGGTPGQPNSIQQTIPDSFGPEIVQVIVLAPDSLQIIFNEKIDVENLTQVTVSLDPNLVVNEILFYDFTSLLIVLRESAELSVPYQLEIQNLTDCSGNEIQDGTIVFALPVLAEADEIKLSEVLFNPRTNGVDFVEVFNDSDKYISLKNWKLGNEDDDGEIDDVDAITINELVMAPEQFLVFTTDASTLLTNYPKAQSTNFFEVSAMPSYPNDEGTVLLIDQSDNVAERFSYNEDFHYNLLESVDGVSLERVSFEESTSNGDNWRSASSTEGFATPGYANSQSLESDVSSGTVTASPEVFIPGNAGSGRDFTTINYQLDQPGKFANVNIYDQTGRLVKNLAQGVLLSTSGFLRWDGDTNDGGVARMGYHLIIFEIYDSSGNSETIKETVVVGRDF